MDDYEHLDLNDLSGRLRAVQRRLDAQAAPSRVGFAALGPAGLFALAAAEQRLADAAQDRQVRRVHVVAANAAQRLGERLAFDGTL
jgi:hypothetical protein